MFRVPSRISGSAELGGGGGGGGGGGFAVLPPPPPPDNKLLGIVVSDIFRDV